MSDRNYIGQINLVEKGKPVQIREFLVSGASYGDGVVVTAFNQAAIEAAITQANGQVPVYLPVGTYAMTGTLTLTTGTHLVGQSDGFIYGPTARSVNLSWSAGTTGISIPLTAPYVTLENMTINGASVLTTGISGGYFNRLLNMSVIGCLGGGYSIVTGSQASVVDRCGFNGNQDGIITAGAYGTLFVSNSVMRQNTRYGINLTGSGGVMSFRDCIVESNTSYGLYVNGTFLNIKFDTCYFEANDGTAATDYEIYINNGDYLSQDEGIVFSNCYSGSVGSAKVANIAAGRVHFRDCSHVGEMANSAVTVAGGAVCSLMNSFNAYPNTGVVTYTAA